MGQRPHRELPTPRCAAVWISPPLVGGGRASPLSGSLLHDWLVECPNIPSPAVPLCVQEGVYSGHAQVQVQTGLRYALLRVLRLLQEGQAVRGGAQMREHRRRWCSAAGKARSSLRILLLPLMYLRHHQRVPNTHTTCTFIVCLPMMNSISTQPVVPLQP